MYIVLNKTNNNNNNTTLSLGAFNRRLLHNNYYLVLKSSNKNNKIIVWNATNDTPKKNSVYHLVFHHSALGTRYRIAWLPASQPVDVIHFPFLYEIQNPFRMNKLDKVQIQYKYKDKNTV